MDDSRKVEKKNQKAAKVSNCCATATGPQILESLPAQEPATLPYCGNSGGGTAISEGSLAGNVQPKIASMTTAFWVWGLAGLTGITILIISAGIVPGITGRPTLMH